MGKRVKGSVAAVASLVGVFITVLWAAFIVVTFVGLAVKLLILLWKFILS